MWGTRQGATFYRDYFIRPYTVGYEFEHESYDGAIDANDHRCGTADSIEDAQKQIDFLILENE